MARHERTTKDENDPSLRGQRGIGILETVMGLGILGFIGIAFLTAISTNSRAAKTLDDRATAERLAISQLEDIKNAPFDSTPPVEYAVTVTTPPEFQITVGTSVIGTGLHEVTVNVSRAGQPYFRLKDYKVDR